MILVTGASGFIGGGVCSSFARTRRVRAIVRQWPAAQRPAGAEFVRGELSSNFRWSRQLEDVSVVVHCAARVHVLKENSPHPLADFREVNVAGTMNLARQAANAGVGRFIFLSSIGVNGLESGARPIRSDDPVWPRSDYALSKYEAETELLALAGRTKMEVVIIRPPLVYGPSAPGNLFVLMRWISRGIPLPLGAVTGNRRSFIYLQNLVDLIETCIDHPAAANQVLLASDGEDLSTTDLLIRIGRAMRKPARLVPVPTELLYKSLVFLGKAEAAQSLCRSLEIDNSRTRELLDWEPATSVDTGLRAAAAEWCESN